MISKILNSKQKNMISKILNSKQLKEYKEEIVVGLVSGLVVGLVFGLVVGLATGLGAGLANLFILIPKESVWIFLLIISIVVLSKFLFYGRGYKSGSKFWFTARRKAEKKELKEKILKEIDNYRSEIGCFLCGADVPCDTCDSKLNFIEELKQIVEKI